MEINPQNKASLQKTENIENKIQDNIDTNVIQIYSFQIKKLIKRLLRIISKLNIKKE